MADGIRIQPQRERLRAEGITDVANRLFIIRDVARPIPDAQSPANPVCRICGRPHEYKTYHFQLDGDGTIMVSTEIWENLLKMYDHGGFEKVNVVAEPPAQHIELPTAHVGITPAQF